MVCEIDPSLDAVWQQAQPEEEQQAQLRLQRLLSQMPSRGDGLHRHIMKCAVCAWASGISAQEAISQIDPVARMHCARYAEVAEAVAKAYATVCPTRMSRPHQGSPVGKEPTPFCRNTILRRFGEKEASAIMDHSPVAIPEDPRHQTKAVLECLYQPEDILLIGNQYAKRPYFARAYCRALDNGISLGPLIMPNPLSGRPGKTKLGKESFRCDNAVRLPAPYLVVEFDDLPLKTQIAIVTQLIDAGWVDCVAYSGSKSIHAWLRVDAQNPGDWDNRVKAIHSDLVRYGADPSTANLSRLSRLPGAARKDKNNRIQSLLYLRNRGC